MVCSDCAAAADGTPGAEHCGRPDEHTPHCTCAHRTSQHRTHTLAEPAYTAVHVHIHPELLHIDEPEASR